MRRRSRRLQGSAPAEGGGSERQESTRWIPAREQKNAPSRFRLRPAHPIDLRRSDCRAGEPSTSSAPCSVHSERYSPISAASRTSMAQSFANCDIRISAPSYVFESPVRGNSTQKCTEAGAPSSGLPTDRRRSGCPSGAHQPPVLRPQCTRHTRACAGSSQAGAKREIRSLRTFLYNPHTLASCAVCSTSKRDQRFAEPGALSSTSPADLPLPRTASRESFVLLASRARRSGNLISRHDPRKWI